MATTLNSKLFFHAWKRIHYLYFDIRKAIDDLHFHVREMLHQLDLSALVGEILHYFYVEVFKCVYNLNLDIRKMLHDLYLAVKVEGLAVLGDKGAVVFVDARLLVVRLGELQRSSHHPA